MPIALKSTYSVSSDAKTLTVADKSGQYSVLSLGGWDPTGIANPKASEATVAEVRIAKRNADGTFGVETTVNSYPSLPSDISGTFDITATLAGQGGTFSDGVYRFQYLVSGIWVTNGSIPFLVTKTVYVPLIPSICACWQKASAAYADANCACTDKAEKLNSISRWVRFLEGARDCQSLNSMQLFINKLTTLCADDCACGE